MTKDYAGVSWKELNTTKSITLTRFMKPLRIEKFSGVFVYVVVKKRIDKN
jgi:hypothetical protein